MILGEIVDQIVDRLENRVERILIAGQDHPARHRAGAAGKGVEGHVDHFARILVACARALRGLADLCGDGVGEVLDQRALQFLRGAEMVEEIGMRAPDPHRDRLERDGLWAFLDEQRARCLDRGITGFFRAETSASY